MLFCPNSPSFPQNCRKCLSTVTRITICEPVFSGSCCQERSAISSFARALTQPPTRAARARRRAFVPTRCNVSCSRPSGRPLPRASTPRSPTWARAGRRPTRRRAARVPTRCRTFVAICRDSAGFRRICGSSSKYFFKSTGCLPSSSPEKHQTIQAFLQVHRNCVEFTGIWANDQMGKLSWISG